MYYRYQMIIVFTVQFVCCWLWYVSYPG